MRHLPLADRIVVLGVGGNVQQIGTFAELSHCDGYVHDLALLKTAKAEPEIEKSTQTLRKPPPVNLNARAEGKGNMSDSGTKDVGTYRFYSFSIGWWRIFILLSAAVLLAFGTKFPRQFKPFVFLL